MKCRVFFTAIAAAMALSGCGNEITHDSSQTVSESDSETVTTSQTTATSAAAPTTWEPSLPYTAASRTTAAKTTTTTTTKASETAAKTTTATTAATTTAPKPKPASTAATAASAPAPSGNDKTKPVVFYGAYSITHLVGNPFDLNSYVSYGDDTDTNPKLTYSGYVNPNAVGTYNITARVTDASGNYTSWGIRVGTKYGSYTLDPYFKTNLKNAKAAGLEVGVYLYTTDHSQAAARDSARWIINQLGGTKLELPVAFDWEELSNFQRFGASLNDINNAYSAFKSELAKSGYSAMIYGNPMTLNNMWSASNKSTSPVWLAHYVESTGYSGSYGIWQQCYGRIPGISGDTDFNIMYTNKKYK